MANVKHYIRSLLSKKSVFLAKSSVLKCYTKYIKFKVKQSNKFA